MNSFKLTLIPFEKSGKPPIHLDLSDALKNRPSLVDCFSSSKCVFFDYTYTAELDCDNIVDVIDVRFYVNDTLEKCQFSEGKISFPPSAGILRRIFQDYYGFVEIMIVLQYADNTEKHLYSEYLPVMVRSNTLNDSVKAMTDYVYEHQESLLWQGEKSKDSSGLKESDVDSLEAQLLLAEDIATTYEKNYSYFKTNCRFRIDEKEAVERIEHLRYVTPKTLQYIASHPEHLKQVNGITGINLANRKYYPERTLISQQVYSTDTFENRAVLNFMQTMVLALQEIQVKVNNLIEKFPQTEIISGEYVYSPHYIYTGLKKRLLNSTERLAWLLQHFLELQGAYRRLLSDIPESALAELGHTPKPTAIFLSVPQYNLIFVYMHQWFSYGLYDFGREDFMLSFVTLSTLYENYLLAKLYNYFHANGFSLNRAERYHYQTRRSQKYENTKCKNTFVFEGESYNVTLYYQPVIFNGRTFGENEIGLYRNNSVPFDSGTSEEERRGNYYVPDFLIKLQNRDKARYIICDAKFSSVDSVRKHYMKELSYKYLFSITPRDLKDEVSGLCIIYGQCGQSDIPTSFYDKRIEHQKIAPFAEMLPLIEGVDNEGHYDRIEQLLYRF